MGSASFTDANDPTVYPEEERVGEEMLQRWIAELLRPLLERFLNAPGRGDPSFVGADQFVYYRQFDPHRRFAPDVYVLPEVPPGTRVRSWKVWEAKKAPSFVLEVATSDWLKDYVDAPERCAEAGVEELVVFDPSWTERPGGAGARWQVYRRVADAFECVERHDRDRVYCSSIKAWLRTVGFGDRTRLRIGTGEHGDVLFPTEAEAAREAVAAERQAKEAERQAKEVERRAKEVERHEKENALERVRALEAELRAIRGDDE